MINTNLEKDGNNEFFNSKNSVNHFYAQIKKMPELIQKAQVIDQLLLNHLPDLKTMSSQVISHFKEQKKAILQHFDHWIMPLAKDVLDSMLQDVEQSKNQLDEKIDNLDQVSIEEWQREARHWVELFAQWNDRNGLVSKILEVVAKRAKYLIDRDIQIIKDYQTQSLSKLPKESEAFESTEKRLAQAIEEPLKQMIALGKQTQNHTSIQQASDWIAKLQEQREIYFNQLLMKIDHVMKDVVKIEEVKDLSSFLEIEGELVFMEAELQQIKKEMGSHAHGLEESDRQFILGRLEGLLDHVEQLHEQALPYPRRKRIELLKEGISSSISHAEN